MKLRRLLEMIRNDNEGAEKWPVLFSSFKQDSVGKWHEVANVRQPITSVQVDLSAEEILLITDSDSPPLSLEILVDELDRLSSCYGDFAVDCCETPIVLDEGERF